MVHIVVMGVSGCGKTSVGAGLAAALGLPFIEGDRLHPKANIDKMAAGTPLIDDDRWPWLDLVGAALAAEPAAIGACSALKGAYRDRLRAAVDGDLGFVFLTGSRAVLADRMDKRQGHFMPAGLLDSQLATLEPPTGEPLVLELDVAAPVEALVEAATGWARHDLGRQETPS
jgi:gluconokinase